MLCKARTKGGARCLNKAVRHGLCEIHYPMLLFRLKKPAGSRLNLKKYIFLFYYKFKKSFLLRGIFQDKKGKAEIKPTIIQKKGSSKHENLRQEAQFEEMMYIDDLTLASWQETGFPSKDVQKLQQAINYELQRIHDSALTSPSSLIIKYKIHKLISRFHLVATQIKRRQRKRKNLQIRSEHDFQSLFHGMLKIFFDDIRAEEFVPSQAGASSRVDFLLKNEKTIVELKMASSQLTDKRLGEELIIDIERYKTHPDCDQLICFIYDPEHHLQNPFGLESDLTKADCNGLEVWVFVFPK